MFMQEILSFNESSPVLKQKGIAISETQAKAIFLLLDVDESGELEPHEITGVLQDRMMLGRNKEIETDMVKLFQIYMNVASSVKEK